MIRFLISDSSSRNHCARKTRAVIIPVMDRIGLSGRKIFAADAARGNQR
jgi:hypothetical protein